MFIIGNLGVILEHLKDDKTRKTIADTIKHRKLTTKRIYDDKIHYKYYVCNIVVWNWYLNRYYPKAELVSEWIHYIKN